MDDRTMRSRRRAIWLAWGAIGGVVVFNLGWLLAGALQGGGYSVASHDVSDLDGSGYPRGLTAAALTPSDPLLAAADVYHAMTEPARPG